MFSLNAGGRSGTFDIIAGDFSAELYADTLNGIYVGQADDPTATTKVAKRRYPGKVSLSWFNTVGDGTTNDSPAVQAAADYCKRASEVLRITTPNVSYELGSTVNIECSVVGEYPQKTSIPGQFSASTEITAMNVIGSRLALENIGIVFNLNASANSAIGFLFGDSTTQFSNNTCTHLYVRNAYRAYVANNLGIGTLWNNTYKNCRANFSADYGWYFDAVVGSTTQSWINCMCDGVNQPSNSKGWYTDNVDDVAWVNCQADDNKDGVGIYVRLASNSLIENFRSEANLVKSEVSQLIYVNSQCSYICNVKLQASEIDSGSTGRFSIVRFGVNGSGVVGSLLMESNTITSGDVYTVDTNSTQFGNGSVSIVSSGITKESCRIDDLGVRTSFIGQLGRYYLSTDTPAAGTFTVGEILLNRSSSASEWGKKCTTTGTAGTLSGLTGSITAGSRLLVISNSDNKLIEGQYLTIAGVAGVKRIVHLSGLTDVYINSDANASVSSAAVSWSAPSFVTLTV